MTPGPHHSSYTHHREVELMDGGFVANNPTLFAIADALEPPNVDRNSIDALSIEIGQYVEPQKSLHSRMILGCAGIAGSFARRLPERCIKIAPAKAADLSCQPL